jgi:uncharacterized protein
MTALLSAGESWRVAALTMMTPQALEAALGGEDAAAWIMAAAACGIAQAQLRLGRMLLEGDGIAQDRAAAFHYFRDAAAQGNIEGHNMLGRCHENGWGTKVDYGAAARDYGVAAAAGLDWAQYNLGHMLLAGTGVARNAGTAFACYSKAAAQGHVRAMNLVGRCHEQGWGTARDPRAALLWYRRSARGGYFRGAFNYASLLVERKCAKGARLWFQRALTWAPEPSRSLMRQKFALERQAAAIAGETAIAADDAVTGHDQGDGIGAIGSAHGAGRLGIADGAGHCAVTGGGAERNIAQRVPYQLIELRPFGGQFEVKYLPFAFGIFVHLPPDIGQRFCTAFGVRIDFRGAGGAQIETHQPTLFVHPGGEGAERRFQNVPIAFFHATSFRLVHRCMVARLRCGAKAAIRLAVCA